MPLNHWNDKEQQEELANKFVQFLNELYDLDPKALSLLIRHRAKCNDAMMNHSTVQCYDNLLSMLGLINGFIGTDENGCGLVAVMHDNDTDKVVGFCRFCRMQ